MKHLQLFCDEIGSDWWIVLTPRVSTNMPQSEVEAFEEAVVALVNRLNDGLSLLNEPGRIEVIMKDRSE